MQICWRPAPQPAVTWEMEAGGGAGLIEPLMVAGAETEEEKEAEMEPVWVTDWVPEIVLENEAVTEPVPVAVPDPVMVIDGVPEPLMVWVLVMVMEMVCDKLQLTEAEWLVDTEFDKLLETEFETEFDKLLEKLEDTEDDSEDDTEVERELEEVTVWEVEMETVTGADTCAFTEARVANKATNKKINLFIFW